MIFYLDHVGEGVQGREGHVGVLHVQVRLVQRQSQLLRHPLLPNECNEQLSWCTLGRGGVLVEWFIDLVFIVVKKKKNIMEERSLI